MKIGVLVDLGDKTRQGDDSGFVSSEDEEEQVLRLSMRPPSIYEELAGLSFIKPDTQTHEDDLPLARLLTNRNNNSDGRVAGLVGHIPPSAEYAAPYTDQLWLHQAAPSQLDILRNGPVATARPPASLVRKTAREPWEGKPVYIPPGYKAIDLVPGGRPAQGGSLPQGTPGQNPYKVQFEEMLRALKYNRV